MTSVLGGKTGAQVCFFDIPRFVGGLFSYIAPMIAQFRGAWGNPTRPGEHLRFPRT
jgi:hypothetical protein